MTRATADRAYRARLAAVRRADTENDAEMAKIAARGGKTLQQMRAIKSMRAKDEFISRWREERE